MSDYYEAEILVIDAKDESSIDLNMDLCASCWQKFRILVMDFFGKSNDDMVFQKDEAE